MSGSTAAVSAMQQQRLQSTPPAPSKQGNNNAVIALAALAGVGALYAIYRYATTSASANESAAKPTQTQNKRSDALPQRAAVLSHPTVAPAVTKPVAAVPAKPKHVSNASISALAAAAEIVTRRPLVVCGSVFGVNLIRCMRVHCLSIEPLNQCEPMSNQFVKTMQAV